MENEKLYVGDKDPKNPETYVALFDILKDKLQILKRKFVFIMKYPKTGESYTINLIYFRREYINQVADCISKLDFDSLAEIPSEKDNCAFQLECIYTKSGSVFGMQIVEARVGSDGGYFTVSPAVVLFDDLGEKAFTLLKRVKKI